MAQYQLQPPEKLIGFGSAWFFSDRRLSASKRPFRFFFRKKKKTHHAALSLASAKMKSFQSKDFKPEKRHEGFKKKKLHPYQVRVKDS